MPTYTSGALRLNYQEIGSGHPLVLLHGFGQHSGAWMEPATALSKFFRVLVPDMRGCGLSDTASPGFTTRDLAADVVALLDHLSLPRAHFSGWSLGGAVGLELGIGHRERLHSLALHSTFAGGRADYQKNWIAMRKQIILSGDKELDMATRIIGFFSPEFVNEHPERIADFKRRELSNPHPGTEIGLAGQNSAAQQHEARDRIHLISVPTLITVGSADRTTLPAASKLMNEKIKGSELFIFDNAGHFPAFQMFDEFVSVSLGFAIKHTPQAVSTI